MKNSNLYSRWLRKEASEDETARLKASGEMDVLEKIIAETDTWSLPELTVQSYEQLKERLSEKREAKVITLKNSTNLWKYSVAASFLLMVVTISILLFFNKTITRQSFAGQQVKVTLPDQSTVVLSGASSITYSEGSFMEKRNIVFEGSGYFEVVKKGDFNVTFDNGTVKVLGTRFTILQGKTMATIKCFEGKIMVTDKNNAKNVLTVGKGIRLLELKPLLFDLTEENSKWTKNESVFNESPLMEVIEALSIHYDVAIETEKIDLKRNYSGKFVHNDLTTALNMVFAPMGIKYSKEAPKSEKVKIHLFE